jgi:hypothetical protein
LGDADSRFHVLLRLRRPARSAPLELYSAANLAEAVAFAERYLARHDRLTVTEDELIIRLGSTLDSPLLTLPQAQMQLQREIESAQRILEMVLSARAREYKV